MVSIPSKNSIPSRFQITQKGPLVNDYLSLNSWSFSGLRCQKKNIKQRYSILILSDEINYQTFSALYLTVEQSFRENLYHNICKLHYAVPSKCYPELCRFFLGYYCLCEGSKCQRVRLSIGIAAAYTQLLIKSWLPYGEAISFHPIKNKYFIIFFANKSQADIIVESILKVLGLHYKALGKLIFKTPRELQTSLSRALLP